MAYIDDLAEQQKDPIGFALKDRKQQLISQKVVEKTARLDPESLVQSDLLSSYNASLARGPESSSLLDFAQSSGYRALGNLGDAGKSISNSIVQTNFDNSEQSGFSNQQTADAAAGLAPEARDQYNQDVEGVYQNIANKDWLSAVQGSLALGPRVLADSASTIPEMIAGTALTATGLGSGAGLTLLGNRGRKVAQGIKAVGAGIDKAKANSKAFSMMANSLKSASNTSIMTADMVQQQVNEYKAENNGESPSGERVAAMIAGNVAANMLEFGVVKNLFLPKGISNPSLKKFKKEASNLLDYAEEGTAESLIKTVTSGIPKVLAAGGAEAAQEYVQTWVEILGVKMKPEEAGGLMASAYKEITDKDNIDQSILGAMLGGSAGGTAKAALGAPRVAAKTVVDVTKGATKAVGRVVQDAGSKAAVGALSEKGLEELKVEYGVQKDAAKAAVDKLTSKIDSISKAASITDLKNDPEISSTIEKYKAEENLSDEQLAEPKNFKNLQNELVRTHKADRLKIAVGFKASNLASMAKKAASVNTDRVKAAAKYASDAIKESDSETVIGTVKDLSSAAVKTVKDIKSSTALGIIEMSANATSEQSKAALKAAKNLELSDLVRVASVVKESNPQLAKGLSSIAGQMERAKTRAGQYTKDTLTNATMPDVIGTIVNVGKVSKDQASAVLANISNASKLKIKDSGAIETLQKALDVYKKSDVRQNVEAVKLIEERLKQASDKLQSSGTSIKDKVSAFVDGLDVKGIKDAIANRATDVLRTKEADKAPDSVAESSETTKVAETGVDESPKAPSSGDQELDNKQLAAIYGIADFAKKEMRKPENAESKDAVLENFIKVLKDNIGETRHSVLDIVENTLGSMTESQKAIVSKYYPKSFKSSTETKSDETVITAEIFDNIDSKELTEQEAKASYTKHFPGCKI